MDDTNAPVLRERLGAGIEVVRLNRPDKRNALDTGLRAVVISTTNRRALCAGADVTESLSREGGIERMAAFTRLYALIDDCPVPTIAVCVGNCVGAGAEIVAGCDLRVGGDNLKLAWAGARLGVPVGPARLAPLVGVARAKDLVYTGRVLGMAEAAAIGLLQRTATADGAETLAIELAATIAAQSAVGVRVLKQMFRDLDGTTSRIGYENERLVDFQRHGGGLPTG